MDIRTITGEKWFLPVVSGVVSFAGGAAVGYFFAKRKYIEAAIEESKQMTIDFTESIEAAIEESKQMTIDFTESIEKVTRRLEEDIVERRGERSTYVIDLIDPEPDEELKPVNVFQIQDLEWDYDAELAARLPNVPYVITEDEFFGDELGWDSQSTLTWYAGDSVLVGEHDEVIYNPDEMIGPRKFGHGSRNPNVFYVRNEFLHTEYEVLLDPSSYEVTVLGGQVEDAMERDDLKHSMQPGKFRGD